MKDNCPDCHAEVNGCGIRCVSCWEKYRQLVAERTSIKGIQEVTIASDYLNAPTSGGLRLPSGKRRTSPPIDPKDLDGPPTSQPDGLTVRQREKIH